MSRVELSNKLDLNRIVFIGRTYEEYVQMFSLKENELKGKRILDCPSGACSFTAVVKEKGFDVTACDIAYSVPVESLLKKGLNDIAHAMESMEKIKHGYKWDFFSNIEELKYQRIRALKDCTASMKKFPRQYVTATLPHLPFQNNEFDLTLSAHFLFMYGDRLDYSFHLKTLKELLRVTKEELRIFPLVDLEGKRYVRLDELLSELGSGIRFKEERVSYEFQANAHTMLKIYKK
ncbi:SAM-dependent methyltransferase [Metabacillus sp. FJAT-53654]|uniref:SAM-dependent methyltransferase n=1 Tax=Metabacillus rhizosphaerae TaxID=3117747 RepID=A0ABZ2MR63_9BACI